MVYVPLNLPNGTTLTAEHLKHIEDAVASAFNKVLKTLNSNSAVSAFSEAYQLYANDSAQVVYVDDNYELCALVCIQDVGGEPKYSFLKASTNELIVVKTNVDNNTKSVEKVQLSYSLPAAGVNLGGVKSGGDVLISNGIITVNDNSHNHSNYTSTSVLPNDGGQIKTKYRVSKSGNTGGNTSVFHYYPLCRFGTSPDNQGNYASAIISGRVGGWTSNNMASINALVWNRGTPSMSVFAIASDALAMSGGSNPYDSSVWDVCDLVLYKESDGATVLYAKCTYWYVFDINIEAYQSTTSIVYDGNPVTPVGELVASASTSVKRVEQVAGGLYVNGQLVPNRTDIEDINQLLDLIVEDTVDIYTRLGNKADTSAIPTKTSQLTNDSSFATTTDVNSRLPTSGGTITGKTTIDTTSNTDMTNPAVNILHTGPADGGVYADLMILSGFKQAPYGFRFRTYGDGTAIIQSQRINSNSEWFNLSLNPNGGKVLINGSYAVNEARLQEVLGSYVNDIDALLGG